MPNFTASVERTLNEKLGEQPSLLDFLAVPDARGVDDAAINSASTTLNSATAAFTLDDVGKLVMVRGAGSAGAALCTTIAAYISATQVTLTAAASSTVSGKHLDIATDSTAAINAACENTIARCAGRLGGVLHLTPGIYGVTDQINIASVVHLRLEAHGATLLAMAPISGAVLKIFNGSFTMVENLMIDSNLLAEYSLWIDTDNTAAAGAPTGVSVQNHLVNVQAVRALVENVRVASSLVNNYEADTTRFTGCRFQGAPKNVGVHSSNSVRLIFDGSTTFGRYTTAGNPASDFPDYNIYVENGGVSLRGVTMEQAQQFDIFLGVGSFLRVDDLYTESNKIIQTDFQGSLPYAILLDYIVQNASYAGTVIDWNMNCKVVMRGCRLGGDVSFTFLKAGSTEEGSEFAAGRGFIGAAAYKLRHITSKDEQIPQALTVSGAKALYTDLVIDGSDNTKVTSAGNPFSASNVGDVLQITGGTGFTVQDVVIYTVDGSHHAFCTASLGTLGSTGGQATVGGRELSLLNLDGYPNSFPVKFWSLNKASTIRNIASIEGETTGEDIVSGSKGDLVFKTKTLITDTSLAERLRLYSSGELQLQASGKLAWKVSSDLDTWLRAVNVRQVQTNAELTVMRANTTDLSFSTLKDSADAYDRWFLNANGDEWRGPGNAAQDIKGPYRRGVGVLGIDGRLILAAASGTDTFFDCLVTGESFARLYIVGEGTGFSIYGGAGGAQDIRIYRSGTSELSLDNHLKLTGSYVLTAAGPTDGTALSLLNRRQIAWGGGAYILEDASNDLYIGVASAAGLKLVHGTQKVYAAADFQVIGNLMNNAGTLIDSSGHVILNTESASLPVSTDGSKKLVTSSVSSYRTLLDVYAKSDVDTALAGKVDLAAGYGDTTNGYKVAGTKVVGAQGASVADVTGTAGGTYTGTEQTIINDLVSQLNALLARVRASTGHGLIA